MPTIPEVHPGGMVGNSQGQIDGSREGVDNSTEPEKGDRLEHNANFDKKEQKGGATQRYSITRDKDDEIIAVLTDQLGDGRLSYHDPRTITIAHYAGGRYTVPWVAVKNWHGLKNMIMLTYGDREDAKREVDEGEFKLRRPGGRIMPKHWDTLSEPWLHVTVKLNSQPKDPDLERNSEYGSDDEEDVENPARKESKGGDEDLQIYERTVKYRIDYFCKDRWSGPHGNFLETKTHDGPITMEMSTFRNRLIPVIEEMNHVTFGSGRSAGMKSINKREIVLDIDDEVKPKRLHVRSSLLLNALRAVVKYASILPNEEENEPFTDGLFPFPFKELVHHCDELLQYKSETGGARANHTAEENAECNEHIDIMVDYLYNEPTIQLQSAKERWLQKVPTTTFAGFWLLMKPGATVYVQEYGQLNAYVIDYVLGGMNYNPLSFKATRYFVRVWRLIFNGKVIKRNSKSIEVPVFDGERDIVSLPVFPTEFHDRMDEGALRKRLIERGQKFLRFSKEPKYLEYTGAGLKPGWKKYNKARMVVEHQSLPWRNEKWAQHGAWHLTKEDHDDTTDLDASNMLGPGMRARAPRCECSRCKVIDGRDGAYLAPTFSDYDDIDPATVETLTDHQALVSMSHMWGFILKDRTYDILDIDGLSAPLLAENAIDELVLRPEKNKDTIKAIARTYTESDSQGALFSVDFIRGKGEGQIFLLHGPPGTGKTLTAESVAEYTKRPLLSITAADLGHEPVELEKNLLRFFQSATAWDAIVLLDEADVYLERRSSNDLRRNSIVSIFLRALDYFEGILFFTTNRVGHFDEAFMSRIHVSIGYDPLDDKAREQIWDTFFRKLKSNYKNGGPRIDYEYDAKQYVRRSDDVQQLQWNGREIRNAFQTAVALAIADSKVAKEKGRPESEWIPLVTEEHLSQVVNMSASFKTYIEATHEGINESDFAYRLGNRNDRLRVGTR